MKPNNILADILKDTITKTGAISFRDFMASALYHPEHGYYSSGIGEVGRDFYTSPSLHSIFGTIAARQITEMWEIMGCPQIFDIIEFGSGSGYLAFDILNSLSDELKPSLRYNIIEVNPKARKTLDNNLRQSDKFRVIKDINDLSNITGCILSNEFLDALPVHIIAKIKPQGGNQNGEIKEVYVDQKANQFNEVYRDCNKDIIEYINQFVPDLLSSYPDNYRTEVNLELRSWINDISRILSKGFVFTIDYGFNGREYFDPERGSGTLICYYKHSVNENPYINIGMQDITSHVNFSALKKWGENAALETIGYCTQGMFLASMGIDEILSEMDIQTKSYQAAINKVKEMLLPQGMGQTHKVLIQSKGIENTALRGFSFSNKKNIL